MFQFWCFTELGSLFLVAIPGKTSRMAKLGDQWWKWVDPQVNKFEQVSSGVHQISVAGGG